MENQMEWLLFSVVSLHIIIITLIILNHKWVLGFWGIFDLCGSFTEPSLIWSWTFGGRAQGWEHPGPLKIILARCLLFYFPRSVWHLLWCVWLPLFAVRPLRQSLSRCSLDVRLGGAPNTPAARGLINNIADIESVESVMDWGHR